MEGPVQVVSNVPEQGGVICRINQQERPCRYQDVRRTLHLVFITDLAYMFANARDGMNKQLQIVLDFAEAMNSGSQCVIGTIRDPQAQKWTTTTAL